MPNPVNTVHCPLFGSMFLFTIGKHEGRQLPSLPLGLRCSIWSPNLHPLSIPTVSLYNKQQVVCIRVFLSLVFLSLVFLFFFLNYRLVHTVFDQFSATSSLSLQWITKLRGPTSHRAASTVLCGWYRAYQQYQEYHRKQRTPCTCLAWLCCACT